MNSRMWFAVRHSPATHSTTHWRRALLPMLAVLLAWPAAVRAQIFEKLVDFDIVATQPANLLLASDGNLYGVSRQGGAFDAGTVLRVKTTGEVDVIASFTGNEGTLPGRNPSGRLVVASDGRLYGTTNFGGATDQGTVFVVTLGATPVVTSFAEFTGPSVNGLSGRAPGTLTVGGDGKLYGTTDEAGAGATTKGAVFVVTPGPSPTATLVTSFTGTTGALPGSRPGELVMGNDGRLYGVTQDGGAGDFGTVFRVDTSAANPVVTHVAAFTGTAGARPGDGPTVPLAAGTDDRLYGVTRLGGAGGFGTVFRVTTGAVATVASVAAFTGTSGVLPGDLPVAALVEGSDNRLYGTTNRGGAVNFGTVFNVTTGPTATVQHAAIFTDNAPLEGSSPQAPLTAAGDNNLYGVANGGAIKIVPGASPVVSSVGTLLGGGVSVAAMVEAGDGKLYGAMLTGGKGNQGLIFRVTPGASPTIATFFDLGPNTNGSLSPNTSGNTPVRPMVRAPDGNFYGTTPKGGSEGVGVIFQLKPDGTYTVLANFGLTTGVTLGNDGRLYGINAPNTFVVTPGATPTVTNLGLLPAALQTAAFQAPLMSGPGGKLFGVTSVTGDKVAIVSITPGVTPVVASVATSTGAIGNTTKAALALGNDGRLYGTTGQGGASDAGTVFRVTLGGTPTVTLVADFTGTTGAFLGGGPNTPLVAGPDGKLYGTTDFGGTLSSGVAYSVTTGATATTANVFDFGDPGGDVGFHPQAPVALGSDGRLYGTCAASNNGHAWVITPGASPTLTDIDRIVQGTVAPLVEGPDTRLYGISRDDGASDFGSIYAVAPGAIPSIETLHDLTQGEGFGATTAPVFGLDGNLYGLTANSAFRLNFGNVGGAAFSVVARKGGSVLAETAGTIFDRLGVPGDPVPATFLATIKLGKVKTQAIMSGVAAVVLVRAGDPAAGVTNGVFAKFEEPAGRVFRATLKTGGAITTANATGLWLLVNGVVTHIKNAGDDAEGVTGGKFKSFGFFADDGDDVFFFATLASGPGNVTTKDDLGLWVRHNGVVSLLTRENAALGAKTVKTIGTLTAAKGSPSAGRWTDGAGRIIARIGFTDRTSALVVFKAGAAPVTFATTDGAAPTIANSRFTTLGLPALGGDAVFLGKFTGAAVTTKNDAAIFAGLTPGALTPIAREGGAAPGAPAAPGSSGAVFTSFLDPVSGVADDAAFIANIAGAPPGKNTGVWFRNSGNLDKLALKGDPVPDRAGKTFTSFTSLALPRDATRGPVFVAKFQGGSGVFAVDSSGALVKVFATGDVVTIGAATKTIRTLTALTGFAKTPGQRRGFDDEGRVIVAATFTDGTSGILRNTLP